MKINYNQWASFSRQCILLEKSKERSLYMIKKWHHVVIKTVMKGTDNYGILNCVFYVSVCINHYNVASTGSLKAAVLWAKRAGFWIGSWPSIVSQFKVMGYKTSLRRFYQLIKLKHSLLYQTFPSIDKVKCCLICIIKSESFSLVISVFFFFDRSHGRSAQGDPLPSTCLPGLGKGLS